MLFANKGGADVMLMRIQLPRFSPAMAGGTLVDWMRGEGEPVRYGDDLCEIAVENVKRLRRTASARMSLKTLNRKARFMDKSDLLVSYVVTSADEGTLRRIEARPGDFVSVGDTLAYLDVAGDAPEGEDPALVARVVVNLKDDLVGKEPSD